MWIEQLYKTMSSILKIMLFARKYRCSAKPAHQAAVILGNGPSLSEMITKNLEFLNYKDIYAVNFFALSPNYLSIKPSNYVMIDFTFYYDNIWDEKLRAKRELLWGNIKDLTNWDMTIYLPHKAKSENNWKAFVNGNKHIRIQYINVLAIEGFKAFRNFGFSKMLGMPRPHNVIVPSLMIALNKKYKKIFLWGVDHSWTQHLQVDDTNKVLIDFPHFYDSAPQKPDVFYFKNTPAAQLHQVLYTLKCTFESYFIIREFAEKLGVAIVNQTKGSMIDAFEREYLPD